MNDLIIGQGQVASFIAFHLIRMWPEPMPPNLDAILNGWIKLTERDFDDFDQQAIKDGELNSYVSITLNAIPKYRELLAKFNSINFIKAVCDSIRNELKELKEI